jgi:hypothetical protein
MAKAKKDIFANVAHIEVTQSAANTLTFQKLETGVSLFEKLAWVIHRIEYFFEEPYAGLDAANEEAIVAITTSDQITALSLNQPTVIDMLKLEPDFGDRTGFQHWISPWTRDFASLPSGGLIVPPNPIYLGFDSLGIAQAETCEVRIYYTNFPLAADEFWELVESRRIISSS